MGMAKWIGGVIGWAMGGPLGALAGYAIGSLFESGNKSDGWQDDAAGRYDGTAHGGRSGSSRTGYDEGERNSFLFSLLTMSSYIISADGRIMHSEMEYVRQFLRMNFGEQAVTQGQQILLNLFERKKQMDAQSPHAFANTIRQCGAQIAAHMTYEQRLQLLSFLAGIAKADGNVSPEEVTALKEVARSMGLTDNEVNSMLNLGTNSIEAAYKVLEIGPSASDAEVKKAYRRLVLKHHPDTVDSLGEDIRKAAEEKMKQITEAYDIIKKERGIK
ncbi:MAG: TerB family tellurite resistance protein [Bacteroides sp.]|nr:TerB family tellurite resistance protein [Bacteroides sp.]